MTKDEFKKTQEFLGLTNEKLAEGLFLSTRMVEFMRSGKREIAPRTAWQLRRLEYRKLQEDKEYKLTN